MGWATPYIAALKDGRTISFRPKGNSMTPLINSGDLVTVSPMIGIPNKHDIVLCRVKGNDYLHLISAIQGNQYQISNNHGHVNGWISIDKIFGILVR